MRPPTPRAGVSVPHDANAPGAPRLNEIWRLRASNILVRITGICQLPGEEAYITGYEQQRGGVEGNYRSLRFSRLAQCVSTGE